MHTYARMRAMRPKQQRGNVTSAGWQVTLCDRVWHVSSRSREASWELLYSLPYLTSGKGVSVAEWLACGSGLRCRRAWVQIAAVHTRRASVHQAAKLVASLLRVAGVTAGLAESNGSLPSGLWLTSPTGWLSRTGISSGTLRSVIEYRLSFTFTFFTQLHNKLHNKLFVIGLYAKAYMQTNHCARSNRVRYFTFTFFTSGDDTVPTWGDNSKSAQCRYRLNLPTLHRKWFFPSSL